LNSFRFFVKELATKQAVLKKMHDGNNFMLQYDTFKHLRGVLMITKDINIRKMISSVEKKVYVIRRRIIHPLRSNLPVLTHT